MVSQNVLFALPVMRTRLARLRVVVGYRGGLGLGVLQHRLNLWPSQKACPQRLILDPLRQFLDDPGGRSPGGARLRRIARCLKQRRQRCLDLPVFRWQAEVCCQPRCLVQAVDGLLAVPLPGCEDCQRPQIGKAVASIWSQAFSQSLHRCSRLALLPLSQTLFRRVRSVRQSASPCSFSETVNSASRRRDCGRDAEYPRARVVPAEKCSCRVDPRESSALPLSVMDTGCGQMRDPPHSQKERQQQASLACARSSIQLASMFQPRLLLS